MVIKLVIGLILLTITIIMSIEMGIKIETYKQNISFIYCSILAVCLMIAIYYIIDAAQENILISYLNGNIQVDTTAIHPDGKILKINFNKI